jgi:superfamily I DNA/RNA helicase
MPAAIEKFGVRPSVVENAAYEVEARREFAQNSKVNGALYWVARWWVHRQIENDPRYEDEYDYVSRYLEYQDAELSLPPLGAGGRAISWDTPTGLQLSVFKERMSKAGCFRYQDMVALAGWHAKRHPHIGALLQERFPLLFFDEMQDTVAEQADLIDELLGAHSTAQRIGDDRQAIYGSLTEKRKGADFPRDLPLTMRRSFRLSPSIAKLAQNVCADSEPEELVGNTSRQDRRHTLYLF